MPSAKYRNSMYIIHYSVLFECLLITFFKVVKLIFISIHFISLISIAITGSGAG